MKWYIYVLCFILIVSALFTGTLLYQELTKESYINGSIDIKNQFVVESFSYANTSVEFYHDLYDETNTYYYTIDLLPVTDFNGLTNEYQIVLNNYVLFDTEINAGFVTAKVPMRFYEIDGTLKCSVTLNITIKFLSNKTGLTLSTVGAEQSQFLSQYFRDYGIRLSINEIKGVEQ